MNRFAVVSDIHGNLLALEAVVADLNARGIESVVNLGDHLSGPLWPLETGRLLLQQPGWMNVMGNHDWNLTHKPANELGLSDFNAYNQLTDELRTWLADQPEQYRLPEGIIALHSSAIPGNHYLLETVENHRARLATPAEIRARLGSVNTGLLLCGHSHSPRTVQLDDMLIVCPGSVGGPAYFDNDGDTHVIETGSPHARYAILEERSGKWMIDHISLQYDNLSAARQAEKNGRPDWEIALRTGFMRTGSEPLSFPGM